MVVKDFADDRLNMHIVATLEMMQRVKRKDYSRELNYHISQNRPNLVFKIYQSIKRFLLCLSVKYKYTITNEYHILNCGIFVNKFVVYSHRIL